MGGQEAPRPVRLRIDLSYDGSGFSGWAAQPGRRCVEDVLAAALGRVLGLPRLGLPRPPALTVAGRTDAGVHATGQVAHLDLDDAQWGALARPRRASADGSRRDEGTGPVRRGEFLVTSENIRLRDG